MAPGTQAQPEKIQVRGKSLQPPPPHALLLPPGPAPSGAPPTRGHGFLTFHCEEFQAHRNVATVMWCRDQSIWSASGPQTSSIGTSAPHGNVLEMQALGRHPRPAEPKAQGPRTCVSSSPAGFSPALEFENCLHTIAYTLLPKTSQPTSFTYCLKIAAVNHRCRDSSALNVIYT